MTQARFGAQRLPRQREPMAAVQKSSDRFVLLDRAAATTIAAEWRALAGKAGEDNVFFEPDFALPAIDALGEGARVAAWRSADGALAAIAPVVSVRLGRIAPAMRLWTHLYGPLGVPLIDRGKVREAVAGLLGGLAGGHGSVVLPEMWLGGAVADAIRDFAALEKRPVAVIEPHERAMLRRSGADAVDCRAALPARRRKEYGRQMRRLAERGDVAIESASQPAQVLARFEEFLALEATGWKGRGGTAMTKIEPMAAMARAIVGLHAANGRMRIDSIRLDGRAMAMLVSFLAGRTAYSWKIAFDESFARFSPGAQLMLEAGRTLLALPGIDQVDSCAAADHPMIDRLWSDRRALATIVVGPPGGGLLHRAGVAALRGEIDARALAKRILRR